MRTKTAAEVVVVVAVLLFSQLAFAVVGSAQVQESALRGKIEAEAISVSVPVSAESAKPVLVKLSLLDPADKVMAAAETVATLKPGTNAVPLVLPYQKASENDVPWYRLRYVVASRDGRNLLAEGIVSVGAIVHGLFDMRMIHQKTVAEGTAYDVRIQTFNPVTSAPVGGVRIKATLTFGDQEESEAKPLLAITNSSGSALLRFKIPNKVAGDEGEVNVEARGEGNVQKDYFDVGLNKRASILITTDKTLYQPGQSFHARGFVMDANRKAIPDTEIDFTLEDPDESTVFRAQATTNKFGIASIDWSLPDSLRLGDYSIVAALTESDRYSDVESKSTVRVSRYDLPEFTVEAKLDKSYYLGGQNAHLDVSGTYLFGKPVTRGSVRLVEEEDRHWSYSEQKWIVNENAEQKTQLDATGHAKLTIDLTKHHAELSDHDYRRFSDITYAAYVTDQTTGKTEQRRFKIRISRDAIHLYVSHMSVIGKVASFYVTTSYPDGTPASCALDVAEVIEKTRPEGQFKASLPLRSLKTNRYGVAKIVKVKLSDDDTSGYHKLALQAHDRDGASTRYEDSVWTGSDRKQIEVTTDKSLYAKGEPIVVTLASEPMPGTVVVNAIVKGVAMWTSTMNLRRGRAMFVVPYQPALTGEIAITAYSITDDSYSWSIPFGIRTVLYPYNNELKVSIKTDRNSYKPGEPVSANLKVTSADGTSDASALGVVVVDKAVEERVRTDEEFGSRYYGFWNWRWWYGDASLAGISRQDLEKIDLSEPVPDGLDLVAELLLTDSWYYSYYSSERPEIESPASYASTANALYRSRIVRQLAPVHDAVLNDSVAKWKFPTAAAELNKLLSAAKIDSETLRDPWLTPYKFEFDIDRQNRIVRVVAAGPDKRFGSTDDITDVISWNYFTVTAKAIESSVKEAYLRSSLLIRDYDSLRTEVLRSGINLDQVRDPWGNAYVYKFDVSGIYTRIEVLSHGPTAPKQKWDGDMVVWTSFIDYASAMREKIDDAMRIHQKLTGSLPTNDAEFDKALASGDFSRFRQMRDAWNNPYRIAYLSGQRYADSVQVWGTSQGTTQKQKPVTQTLRWVLVSSSGPDGKPETQDDVTLARYAQVIAEQSATDIEPKPVSSPELSGASGAIEGIVLDQSGAVIAGATVTAEEENRGLKFTAITDEKGAFVLRITPGIYRVTITSPGFRAFLYQHVAVHALSVTSVRATLNVGAAAETVEVQASAVDSLMMTSSAMVADKVSRESHGTAQVKEEIFTPRLRDYFPETLFWEPSLITTKSGAAKLNFKLADNITSWKMSVLASTADGHIGTANTEIQAFQPFFVALDPPKILTVGDQIELPVTVRNYLPKAQSVQIEMKPADWFRLLQPGKQNITVPSADSTNALFPFVTLLPVKAGKQQVLAANRTTGDAIEKTVAVHPDGQEESQTASMLLGSSDPIALDLSSEIMPNSLRGELKVYPNLLAHVGESIEASLERPYGCGEQTISSTYPSVLMLRYYKEAKLPDSDVSRRAKKYLELGLQRLMNYQAAGGGFTYWGHGDADVALTAYAIRFFTDAAPLTKVDEDAIQSAQRWLLSVQTPEGQWLPQYGGGQATTAYVARVLALSLKTTADGELKTKIAAAVEIALNKLDDLKQPILEAYTMSMYVLAASDSGAKNRASTMVAKLGALAHKEGNTTYWALETNTPFYGWGRAGRVEATAMAVQALSQMDDASASVREQIASGVLFLLKQKDRYGVWYSGQATVNVLQAMLGVLATAPSATAAANSAAVTINGKSVATLQISNSAAASPVYLDISQYLTAGTNQIVLNREKNGPYASVQAVATYYVPWKQSSDAREMTRLGESRALRLAVKFDKTRAKPGDTIHCSVNAERIGHYGYGMLLAEIGLPPGVDVDRASLDKAIAESGWSVSRYDVLPDRLILYLWPRAGGTKVDFTFRPRFGLKARSASSFMYDYYNPDEQVTLAPMDFQISSN
jgi:hypothetical protein